MLIDRSVLKVCIVNKCRDFGGIKDEERLHVCMIYDEMMLSLDHWMIRSGIVQSSGEQSCVTEGTWDSAKQNLVELPGCRMKSVRPLCSDHLH